MKSQIRTIITILFFAGVFLTLGALISQKIPYFNPDKILAVYNLIKTQYIGNVDETLLANKLLDGLNDKYSYYLDKESYQKEIDEDKLKQSLMFKEINLGIGYLKIDQFGLTTKDEFTKIAEILNQKNIQKLIIDLRNNLGGNTEAAIFIDRQFISSGTLLREKFRSGKENITYAHTKAPFESMKIIILTNRETSSAAEQMAAAFGDNQKAKIIGETTFGKDSIGNYFELKDGSAVHLTIGRWFRPNGESVGTGGIQPDTVVLDEKTENGDMILDKAIELISQ